MTLETEGTGETEQQAGAGEAPSMPMGDQPGQTPGAGGMPQGGPKVEGKRTQLRIVRENIDSLSKDVGNFRKNHEASSQRLEKQVASLRKDLAALKKDIAKDAAKARAKQEKTLSKILAKVNAKPKAAKGDKKKKR